MIPESLAKQLERELEYDELPANCLPLDLGAIFWPDRKYEHQERFVFGGHAPDGCAFYQGWIGGRASGKTVGLAQKALVLALLNPGYIGAICGRTAGEVAKKILPHLFRAIAQVKAKTGIALLKPRGYDKHDQAIHFANGSIVYILSYGRMDQLELIRGHDLAWALFDEIERCPNMPSELVFETVVPAIRAPGAPHKVFGWASSPDGLRGMPAKHLAAWERRDPEFYTVATTIYDNPYIERSVIGKMRAGLSYRQWLQEGLGSCLLPLNVIYGEYREQKHVKPYVWNAHDKTLVLVDWPGQVGYAAAVKVDSLGRWVVAAEKKSVDVSGPRWRKEVEEFVAYVVQRNQGGAVYGMVCDRSPQDEAEWLVNRFSKMCAGGVGYLDKADDVDVKKGHNLVSFMLEPNAGDDPPRLFVADDLTASIDPIGMGMRGGFQRYGFERVRGEDGVWINTDRPNKTNGADHMMDVIRYGVVHFRFDPLLHGGRALPYAVLA